MISLKLFVDAIQNAVANAGVSLMDLNTELLDKFFTEEPSSTNPDKTTLVPKKVILEYPSLYAKEEDGTPEIKITEVQVPLITLVPMSLAQIKKATISVEFEMDIIEGEVHLDFSSKGSQGGLFKKKPKTKKGKLDIVLTPHETAEGVKIMVEGYERMLKRQFS